MKVGPNGERRGFMVLPRLDDCSTSEALIVCINQDGVLKKIHRFGSGISYEETDNDLRK